MTKQTSKKNFLSIYEKIGLIAILILEIIVFAAGNENFLNITNIFLVARQVSFVGIAAVGMTMVLLVGEIDISIGSILAFSGCLSATMMIKMGIPAWISIVVAILVSTFLGLVTGILVSIFKIPSLIATLAMQTIIKGITYLMTGGSAVSGLSDAFKFLGQGFVLQYIPVPVIIMLIIYAFGYVYLNRTYIGRRIYATGGNEESARLSGINTNLIKITTFVVVAFMSGIAGILMSARLGTGQPSTGSDFAMDVLTATILGGVSLQGGKGFVLNVLLGSFVIGVLSNGLVMMGVIEYWQWIIKGVVFIFAVSMSSLESARNK